ncbi:flagellar motor protein MotB [Campylobacter sp. MIT 99-7217]|uniref:flagellar motor protein MotB n=1 Tax=Campylobacter sp. MIT 99-7217 TaxID=535091 RepID=UPI001158F29B|nr:flagellar motor protein MotB [Campylobacter sp. MIT 99-7217]TQR29043.1 flagellar motor protein MotB [Campylobacter sp. MIT 99-7217]
MAKHKCPECPAGEKWAVPYADFLSLLLALFIALWAISESNPAKTEALKTEFIKIFDYTVTQTTEQESANQQQHKGATTTPQDQIDALKSLTMTQQETIRKLKAALDQNENQVALNLPAKVQFARGSAEIATADIQDFLKYMADFSMQLPPQVQIEIRGFTDNSDSALRSYELAFQRAEAVGKFFIEKGVDVKNISLKSYGLNEPINGDASSLENNRVEIYYKVDITDENAQKSVLESIQNFNPNVQ